MTEQPPSQDPDAQPPPPPPAPAAPDYGQAPPPPPPAYWQAPPAYGQAPPAYGQPPPAYGQPGAYGQPQYGQPAPGYAYPYPQPADTSGKATASLVLGIAGMILCGLFTGIPAIFLGISAKRDIDAAQGRVGGRGMATAGIVLGSISIVVSIAVGVLLTVLIANGTNCVSTNTGNSYSVNCA
ncbi:MAG: hypothetical protein JWQ32_839 [Marmoricola sp.]|nr:hypothetical protein [Marmoricola sp.]